ncbi:uncharacterized protein N7515_007121 [Penicillium bovifimosum]|uniref:F-box domain-containing protein n=1 Tax=Penicillium bovifimosum TaxID=126998 RepID=A0A9W9GVZ7_9EURO|nr:uncharacterized protein N7515_007121 [Penicillium bovifimosum]KAJ5131082.1 hypothetical protein N7515_007121 [Penicillium bovifimosum]
MAPTPNSGEVCLHFFVALVAFPCPQTPCPHTALLLQEEHADDDYDDYHDCDENDEYDEEYVYHHDGRPSEDFSRLEQLPPEIIYCIASYLPAADLACLGATSSILADYAMDDLLWAALVNERLPSHLNDPGPFGSFRRLYLAYHPCWFLPQYKIWFADIEPTGLLVIARYNPRRGVIEARKLVADRTSSTFQVWESNPDVMIQTFHPRVHLYYKEEPVMLLEDPLVEDRRVAAPGELAQLAPIQHYEPTKEEEDRYMPMALEIQRELYGILFCTEMRFAEMVCALDTFFWPPRTIPSSSRALRYRKNHELPQPGSLEEMSEFHWRLIKWSRQRYRLYLPDPIEDILTFSTLDPALYTPTKEKPYQGIWVGDYSAHGCEFLLIVQKEVAPPRSENEESEDDWMDEYYWDDSDEEEVQAMETHDDYEPDSQEIVQQGRLEAIKLTGDPNVPRGQYSFVAKDIGPSGLLRVATDEPFVGARIVRSRGHVAGLGFHDHTYVNGELILISPDCLAHYWKEMGHVSYYHRVDIDDLVSF